MQGSESAHSKVARTRKDSKTRKYGFRNRAVGERVGLLKVIAMTCNNGARAKDRAFHTKMTKKTREIGVPRATGENHE
jgi:hypothetical protein